MGYLPFYFWGYGMFAFLLPGIWDICHFTSRDMGYLPFYFQEYGIFAILLPGMWDICSFTSRDVGYCVHFQRYCK